jgi:hypothetical protein
MTNSKRFLRSSVSALLGAAAMVPALATAQPAPATPPVAPATPAPVAAPVETPAPAPAATAPAAAPIALAPAPAAPVVAPPPAPAEPPLPSKLSVGSGGGAWQPGALLQFWIDWSRQNEKVPGKSVPVADEKTLTFRLRRAEVKVKGDIVPKLVGYQVMIDPARALEVNQAKVAAPNGTDTVTVAQPPVDASGKFSALTILNDFFITFQSDYADVSLGQFKIPVSYEGYNSASKILFPERAPVARLYGDKRDMGLRIEKKLGDYFGYSAGLFNGTGQNRLDDDTEKDGALRLEGYLEGATVAAVGYTTLGKRQKASRDRVEVDVKYDAHDAYLIGEYIHAWDTKGGGKAVEGHGGYVEAAYTLFKHLQPMVRVGDVEPDMDKPGDHYWHYEAGVGWLLQKNEAKLQLALAIFDPTNPSPPTNPKRTELILAAQAGF